MAPGVSSLSITSHAPTPRMPIWRTRRRNLDAEVMDVLRLLARACKSRDSAFCRCQRRTNWGIIPMASMTSALRTAASARFNALKDATDDAARRLRVANSLVNASANRTLAPASDSQPSSGCNMKMTPRKIGVHGASMTGKMPGPERNVRKVARSRSACTEGSVALRSVASTLPASTEPLMRASSQVLRRMRTVARIASKAASAISAKPATSISMTRVSVLRLDSTRSKTCSMNSGAVSMRTLMPRLNATTARNPPRHAPNASFSCGLLGPRTAPPAISFGRRDDNGSQVRGIARRWRRSPGPAEARDA